MSASILGRLLLADVFDDVFDDVDGDDDVLHLLLLSLHLPQHEQFVSHGPGALRRSAIPVTSPIRPLHQSLKI